MTLGPRSVALRRVGLGLLVAAELVRLAVGIGRLADPTFLEPPPADASLPLYDLAMSPWLVWTIAAAGVLGALGFALRRAPLLGALGALGCAALLFRAHELVRGQHDESFVQPAAALAGWLVGWGLAWLLGVRSKPDGRDARVRHADAMDVFGVTGALAFFGATYFNAGLCKLLASGPLWLDPLQLQTVLAMFLGTGEATWVHEVRIAVMGSPALCSALLVGTLVIELGGVLLPFGQRARTVAGTALLAMHAGMFLLATIIFWPAVILLCLFTFPWERLGRRRSEEGARVPTVEPSGGPGWALAATASVVAIAWLTPLSAALDGPQHPLFVRVFEATREHNSRVIGSAGQPEREPLQPLAALGPLTPGLALPDGWTLAHVDALGEGALLTLGHPAQGQVLCDLTVVGPDSPPRPFEAGGLELQYRRTDVPFEAFGPALEEVARLARAAVQPAGAEATLREWLNSAPPAPP